MGGVTRAALTPPGGKTQFRPRSALYRFSLMYYHCSVQSVYIETTIPSH